MVNRLTIQNRRWFTHLCVALAACASAAAASAQDTTSSVASQERQTTQNADGAATPKPAPLARAFDWADRRIDGTSDAPDGLYPEMGGMIPGAGFSAGPGYRHRLFGGRAVVDASAAVSWRGYRMTRSQFAWPRLLDDRLSVGSQVKYEDFTQINFFGVGDTSRRGDQTDYRLKAFDALGFATLRPVPWLGVTGRAGVMRRLDIQSGTSPLWPSTDQRFDEGAAPGLTRQPNYFHTDVAADVDTRDVPGYPSSGGRYRVSMAMFRDQDFSSYSFNRFEADAAQYLPIGRSVFALRGRIDLSRTGAGQQVPFYLLPSLGGSSTLRAYADYRFRDRDLALLDAEYRWPILRRVDGAVFYDAGTLAPEAGALGRRVIADYGVGLRLHSARHLMARLDVARGREGTRALVTFSAPLAAPSRSIAPYVP